jgi:D-alanine-D-alanine ligase
MLNVGLVFGGVSPEHEVSVISTLQAAAALDTSRFAAVPVYIAKDGTWYTGQSLLDLQSYRDLEAVTRKARKVVIDPRYRGKLRLSEPTRFGLRVVADIDVVLPGLHGGSGENGGLQGLCEVVDVAYAGSGILGSSVGMDKCISKILCREQGIPVVEFAQLREVDWAGREERQLDALEGYPGLPCVVKPARLGSSIGIGFAKTRDELNDHIEEALRYDDKIVVEQAVPNLVEINCAVLGLPGDAIASVLEQPVGSDGAILSYGDKYMRGGSGKGQKTGSAPKSAHAAGMASLDRIIPAPLDEGRTADIQNVAVRIFTLLECSGCARIDFMINSSTGQLYFNEINTIPGSFSFYLWQPAGVDFTALVTRLIEIALHRHRVAESHIRSYDVNLLSAASLKGLKGTKG